MSRRSEITLAAVVALMSLAGLFVWLPNDIETGLVYHHRRQTYIGDTLIPAVSLAAIALASLVQIASLVFGKPADAKDPEEDATTSPVPFVLAFGILAVLIMGCIIMYWLGPLVVSTFLDDGQTYRNLRGTMPWNLIGYFFGGLFMLVGVSLLIEGRLRLSRAIAFTFAILALIAIFQGPFDNLLLPPNGDW